jgi:uncharacterized DUF497 family protein
MAYIIPDDMRFEWDPEKDLANRSKHELSFEDASELFTGGVDYLVIYDEPHSDEEDRFMAIGPTQQGVVVVVYTERQDDLIRILSARKATRNEQERLESH